MNVPVKIVSNGMRMPVIGLGTYQATNERELVLALNAALECGYRHIDTAYVYQNEEIIGRVLKAWFTSGKLKREEIFITTKLPIFGLHEDRVQMFLDQSLQKLGLKYVDLYLIHFPIGAILVDNKLVRYDTIYPGKADHIKIWKRMEQLVDAGKTKYIGVSNFSQKQLDRIWNNSRIKPSCQQIELHMFLQQPEMVRYCRAKKIAVVAYSPLASPKCNRKMAERKLKLRDLPNIFTNSLICEVAKKHKKTNAQIALRYMIEIGMIPIPKSVTPSRIRENLKVFNFRLDADDLKKLRTLDLGEECRVYDLKFLRRLSDHPEWPFPK